MIVCTGEYKLIGGFLCIVMGVMCRYSQADVGTEAGEVDEEERHDVAVAPNLPVTVQKTNRVDVTDRFGKFDIRQELERKQSTWRVLLLH